MTAQALVFLIGVWAILTGIFEVIAGFELPIKRDWLLACRRDCLDQSLACWCLSIRSAARWRLRG